MFDRRLKKCFLSCQAAPRTLSYGLWSCSSHSFPLHHCRLSMSVKVEWKQLSKNPELIWSERCQTDDPVLLVSGLIPSVKKRYAGGKRVRERKTGEQQCHCLPLSSDTGSLGIAWKCVTDRRTKERCWHGSLIPSHPLSDSSSSDSSGFRLVQYIFMQPVELDGTKGKISQLWSGSWTTDSESCCVFFYLNQVWVICFHNFGSFEHKNN